jgi:uncharacterized membrane protein
MMDLVAVLRWLHVLGASVFLGTGAGIAFFMVMAHRSRKASLIAHVAETVTIADLLFTATAVVLQPITGYLLARAIGWPFDSLWIGLSLCLYVLIGLFWLPVVFIQIRLRDLARAAATANAHLPPLYFRLYRIWFLCGFPAFFALLVIFWLMLAKPV